MNDESWFLMLAAFAFAIVLDHLAQHPANGGR